MGNMVLPTLSVFGVTADPQIITEKLFLYFITSEYSQSVTFYGKISSLKYLLRKFNKKPDELKLEIYDTLITLYKKYFYNVDIQIDLINDDDVSSIFVLGIRIVTETDDGVVSTVDERLKVDGTNISNILDLIYR